MDLPGKTSVTVVPTAASLGADIAGVDLSRPVAVARCTEETLLIRMLEG